MQGCAVDVDSSPARGSVGGQGVEVGCSVRVEMVGKVPHSAASPVEIALAVVSAVFNGVDPRGWLLDVGRASPTGMHAQTCSFE